jgi:phospholipid transport system transporter-binding protein
MIQLEGNSLRISGAMTLREATALLADGCTALRQGATVFDLSAVETVDSSAIAVVFGWLRAARAGGGNMRIEHPPQDFLSLAEVYGVVELLPLDY